MNCSYTNLGHDMAQVAIPQSLLAKLITKGFIHGDDCMCLNAIAKATVWQTLLTNSLSIIEAD